MLAILSSFPGPVRGTVNLLGMYRMLDIKWILLNSKCTDTKLQSMSIGVYSQELEIYGIFLENNLSLNSCQTPTKSLVKRLRVDFVFTPSQWQWQSQSQQPHKKKVLAGNLESWFLVCNLILTQIDEIWRRKIGVP